MALLTMALLTTAQLSLATTGTGSPSIPSDWAKRVADGRMLWNPTCTVSNGHVSSVWGDHAPVANGYLGSYIDSGTVFIAGTFTGLADKAGMVAPGSNVSNGKLQRSHLARVPSKLAVRVSNATAVGCALDLERATYYRRTSIRSGGATVSIEQRWYAHKTNKALLVMEMDTISASATTLALSLDQENSSTVKLPPSYIESPPQDDVVWEQTPIPGCPAELWCQVGNTTTPDVPTTLPTTIAYVSTRIPPTLAIPAGNQSLVFLAAARSTHVSSDPLADALAVYKAAAGTPGSPTGLLQSHRAAWLDTWSQSVIEFEGDDFVQRAINATLYIILSGHDETFSTGFPVSMEGLVEGAFGHWGGSVLWDADYWIYPAISMFRPTFQRDILQYRYNTIDQARLSARRYGNKGAKYSWESSSSGAEVSSGPGCSGSGFPCPAGVGPNGCGIREIHIGADIVVTARRHWWQTRNTTWLREVGQPIAAAVADYYCSRTTPSASLPAFLNMGGTSGAVGADQLSIAGVLGPDEHDDNVTDSTYTNAAAIAAIEFAIESAEVLNLSVDPLWQHTASRLHIPFDARHNIHPEFVGMPMTGFQGKQADTVMLYFPLEFNLRHNISEETARADLEFYAAHTAPSPDMTHAIQAVAALDRAALSTNPKWRALADAEFLNSYQKFCFKPYYMFSENSNNGGDVLYLTSGAGFLQTLIYGYGGVRVLPDALQLRPVLPPNATHFALRGIEYMGAVLSLVLDGSGTKMTVAMTSGGSSGKMTLTDSSGKTSVLAKGASAWTGAAQRVTVAVGKDSLSDS